jgi:hypothetical protein
MSAWQLQGMAQFWVCGLQVQQQQPGQVIQASGISTAQTRSHSYSP